MIDLKKLEQFHQGPKESLPDPERWKVDPTLLGKRPVAARLHQDRWEPRRDGGERIRVYTTTHQKPGGNVVVSAQAYSRSFAFKKRCETLPLDMEASDYHLVAIEGALELVLTISNRRLPDLEEILIFCDNRVAIRSMADLRPKPGQYIRFRILDAVQALLRKTGAKVTLHYAARDCGIPGNQQAIKAAQLVEDRVKITRPTLHQVSLKAAKQSRINCHINDWQDHARKCLSNPVPTHRVSRGYSKYFQGPDTISLSPHSWYEEARREDISAIFQILSNKGFFGAGYKWRTGSDDRLRTCRSCGYRLESINHMIIHCPSYDAERRVMMRGIRPNQRLRDLIRTDHFREALLKFVHKTKILDRHAFHAHLAIREAAIVAETGDNEDQSGGEEEEEEEGEEGEEEDE